MKEKELKAAMDEVYAIGFKNGQTEMKNKVLKKINRDWSLFRPDDVKTAIKIMKNVNKIRLSAAHLEKK